MLPFFLAPPGSEVEIDQLAILGVRKLTEEAISEDAHVYSMHIQVFEKLDMHINYLPPSHLSQF